MIDRLAIHPTNAVDDDDDALVVDDDVVVSDASVESDVSLQSHLQHHQHCLASIWLDSVLVYSYYYLTLKAIRAMYHYLVLVR